MPGEECRGLAQHRPPSSVVLHCRRRSNVWPNVSLLTFDTQWQARHRRRLSFPWGTKPQGTTKSFPWETKPRGRKERKEELHPMASAASLTPPQLPLGDETPRHNSLASAATSSAPASIGGRNSEEKFMEEEHEQRRTKISKQQGSWTQTRPMVIKDHGHTKDHGYNNKKRNDKEDAQPPRVRQTKQASPPGCNFYVLIFMFSPTTQYCGRARAKEPEQEAIGSERERKRSYCR